MPRGSGWGAPAQDVGPNRPKNERNVMVALA